MRPPETSGREKKRPGRILRHIGMSRVKRTKSHEGNRHNDQRGRREGERGVMERKGGERPEAGALGFDECC